MLFFILIALFALAAITLWRAQRHETIAESEHPPEGQFIEIDGLRVHAITMGAGPDLVLIHGASGNTRDMTFSLAPKLAERYRVIVFDRPGLGYTDRINTTGATIAQQAELLMRAARKLGAQKPVVVGQSYGGAVALAWAVHYPTNLSALVPLATPSMPWSTPLDPLYRVTSTRPGSALVVPLITAFVPDSHVEHVVETVFAPQAAPTGYAEFVGAGLTLRRETMRANAMQRANLLGEIVALSTRYGEVAVPTEIVHGTADTTVSLSIHSEKLVKQIPDATLARLVGIGHMPHHAAQDDVIAAIDRATTRAGLR